MWANGRLETSKGGQGVKQKLHPTSLGWVAKKKGSILSSLLGGPGGGLADVGLLTDPGQTNGQGPVIFLHRGQHPVFQCLRALSRELHALPHLSHHPSDINPISLGVCTPELSHPDHNVYLRLLPDVVWQVCWLLVGWGRSGLPG